jgi:O-antigen/teichoic acid export membrane protein
MGDAPDTRGALTALVWNYGGAAVNTVIQLCYTAYTARTVLSSAFGAQATALALLNVLTLFGNAGLTTCLLRSEKLTRPLLRTAFLVAAVSGMLSCLAVQATASLCAGLWHVPLMEPLLRILGLQFLVLPAAAAATAALRRCGHARISVAADLGGQVAGLGTGAILLASGWNPYGLAASFPVASACTLLVGLAGLARSGLIEGPRIRARSVIGISGAFVGFGLLQIAALNSPLWLIVRFFGPSEAGQFSRAAMVVGIPLNLLCQGLHYAVTPSLARAHGRGLPMGRRSGDFLTAASALAFIPFGIAAGVGPAVLGLLLGRGWEIASGLVPLLALNSALYFLCSISYAIDEVRRSFRSLLVCQSVLALTVALAVGAATSSHDLALVPAAMALGPALGHVIQLTWWHRAGLVAVVPMVRVHLVHAAIGGSFYLAGRAGAHCGRSPLGATLCGLAAVLPVAAAWFAVRRYVPVFATAAERGLLARPTAVGSS